jgi:endonuclease/exonuclease/phosphatase (EEP) superfamily protein YafD
VGSLSLADKTKANRLGLAIYFNPERFSVLKTDSFPLQEAWHDKLFSPAQERLLVTKLYDKFTGQDVLIGSFHATPLTATNYIRRKQIETAHSLLTSLSDGKPTIMVGDYNYPIFKRGLRVCIEKSGYELSFSDKPTYYFNKFVRGGHFDLATSLNLQIEKVSTLPKGLSDHAPILVQATL